MVGKLIFVVITSAIRMGGEVLGCFPLMQNFMEGHPQK